jgi:hypothetical protein
MTDFVKVPELREPLIPVSHLALDLPAPASGDWHAFLAGKGIRVVPDDVGRDCVASHDAARLVGEKRGDEVRRAALARLAEQEAVEADERRRAQIWKGVPADAMRPDALPASVMLQAVKDSRPRRLSPLQEALSNEETLTFHPFPQEGEL